MIDTESSPTTGAPRHRRAWWAGAAVAAVVLWAALTWPFVVNLGSLWQVAGDTEAAGQPAFLFREGAFATGDHLQNVFIDSVIVDNLRELREPYLDRREGAAGPAPLRTTSLNLPWTPVVALLWPVVGLVTAYNLTLLLSSVATVLTAFGWLRRHTRWPLLALAGALAYAAVPHRMYQLTVHFNAVMWWAFPAVLWAFEAMLERWRAAPAAAPGRRLPAWTGPTGWLAATVGVVGLSGEYHLDLYLAGLLGFLVPWTAARELVAGRRGPWAPLGVVTGSVAAACGYVLLVFGRTFTGGEVAGGNGGWDQVVIYGPQAVATLVHKTFGESGEGMVYVGWAVVALAAGGTAATLLARRGDALPYAVLVVPVLFLTFGPAAHVGGFTPYRWAFDHVPFLSLQRVPQRLMVVTALLLLLLAVVAVDQATRWSLASRPGTPPAWARRMATGVLVAATVALLADYRLGGNRVTPSETDNAVVARLRHDGDGAGPIAGLPALNKTMNWNASTTYVAALSRRRSLNAYNQTPSPWLDARLAALETLNRGEVGEAALAALRETGTRQLLVTDEPHVYDPGEWRRVVDKLAASGHFRVAVDDAPMALLELTD